VVLVDTTVWIDLLRNCASVPVARLQRLLERGDAAVTPVIVQEVLQGAEDEKAFARLSKHFLALPMLMADDPVSIHVAAARLYARARWQGITPRSPHDLSDRRHRGSAPCAAAARRPRLRAARRRRT
jgi:predicted nucleic acid-binding protein